jgi:cobaltochelatase CobN
MHLLPADVRSIDAIETAEDLGQTPADVVVLSFSDSDLAAVAAAWGAAEGAARPSLRLAALGRLKHPYSVDLYLEKVAARAKLVLVRLLGGADYWRYGLDELGLLARSRGVALAVVPGDHVEDLRLDRASTLPAEDLRRIWAWFQESGPDNMASLAGWLAAATGHTGSWHEPAPVAAAVRFEAGCRALPASIRGAPAPRVLVLFYRSQLLAADTAPVEALAAALAERGLAVTTLAVTSLKDPRAGEAIAAAIDAERPAAIINTTAFSGALDAGGTVLDRPDVPVLQAILPTTGREAWAGGTRGLGAADLAMNVVLPELDGRIVTRAISFKRPSAASPALEFSVVRHEPEPEAVAAVADLAAGWIRLGRTPRAERRIAVVLSDYPAKGGRTGYAVGLDASESIRSIGDALGAAGFATSGLALDDPMAALEGRVGGAVTIDYPVSAYVRAFADLPAAFRDAVVAAWGPPEEVYDVVESGEGPAFRFRVLGTGGVIVAVQPDRGRLDSRKADYHDPNRPPRHSYVAFYLWLRHVFGMHAMVHLGTHGTLEWLPGKAVAPSPACTPTALVGPTPVVYPFIVNNPGEAAQAKRRIGAVTLGHLTPMLVDGALTGAAAEIEALLDEYAEAQGLDPRRAGAIGEAILDKADAAGLLAECGAAVPAGAGAPDRAAALARLDAWLCDIKELRIGDGLHVFGRAPEGRARQDGIAALAAASGLDADAVARRLDRSARDETAHLVAALDGRFVPPGPAGAPARGRLDVLPTGRNLTATDPRAIPTVTAQAIGRRLAAAVMDRHAQDHGEWPRRIVVDLWGSATIRTGGDDLAQAFALLGVALTRDATSNRVSGFEVIPPSRLDRPRVDVTLRVSGLFRDVFSLQMALFDEAVRAIAALDEPADINPLAAEAAAEPRVFGAAPGAYGTGLGELLTAGVADRDALGRAYLAGSAHAYGAGRDGEALPEAFAARVAAADAFVHTQDNPHQDVLDSDAFATHEGGFAAAAASLGNRPALYHADTTAPGAPRVRTLGEEVARVLRGRATNPRWLDGQMRHGHRGAAEIAETIANLHAFAATAAVVTSRQFDLAFDATLGDERVRDFMLGANPDATRAAARAFADARQRGWWTTRRNSTLADLASLTGEAA